MIRVWGHQRSTKTFFGMTLDVFSKIVAPSGEARAEIAELERRMREAVERRNEADRITRRAVLRVVNAVKGDPEEGEDSELLASMGYLPHTARSSIVSMARRNAAKAAKASETGEEDEQT